MPKQYTILSMGAIYLDTNCFHYPFREGLMTETETVGSEYEYVLGGSAVNFARIAASLELGPIFVGKIGNDVPGEIITKLMLKSGIEPALINDSMVQTNINHSYINNEGETIMAVAGSANRSLKPSEALEAVRKYINKIDYLYLGGYFKMKSLHSIYPEIIELAHQAKVGVILDHGRVTNEVSQSEIEILQGLISTIDIYFPSEGEFIKVWGATSVEEGLKHLQTIYSGTTVVKQGENGATSIKNGKIIHVDAFKVAIINTAGAGDSFNAGFMKAKTEGCSLQDSIKTGCATASLKISQDEIPTWEKVKNFVSLINK